MDHRADFKISGGERIDQLPGVLDKLAKLSEQSKIHTHSLTLYSVVLTYRSSKELNMYTRRRSKGLE